MKILTAILCVVSLAGMSLPAGAAEKIQHVVSFKFKSTAKPEDIKKVETAFADLKNNEVIVKGVRGVKQITVWLERDMIEWDNLKNPLKVRVEGDVNGFKPRPMSPDLQIMFEELYRTGDRKMLFFGKLVFKTQG